MKKYIEKQTTINPNELLQSEFLSVNEALHELNESETPEAQFYKGYVDAVHDLEEGNKKLYEAYVDKNKHYLAGYEAAVKYNDELKKLNEKKAYYNQKLKEWKEKNNVK